MKTPQGGRKAPLFLYCRVFTLCGVYRIRLQITTLRRWRNLLFDCFVDDVSFGICSIAVLSVYVLIIL